MRDVPICGELPCTQFVLHFLDFRPRALEFGSHLFEHEIYSGINKGGAQLLVCRHLRLLKLLNLFLRERDYQHDDDEDDHTCVTNTVTCFLPLTVVFLDLSVLVA